MQKKVYDIIVVGAGMAGLSTAMALSKEKGVKCLLIDKERKITAYHMIGTFREIVDRYDLHGAVVNRFKGFRFFSPKEKADISFTDDHYMCYMDLKKLAELCAKRVAFPVKSHTEIVSARYYRKMLELTDKKGKKYYGRVVIDCSGNTAVVADSLGIQRSRVYCKTFSYSMHGAKVPKKFSAYPMMYQDASITRCAGAWVTPYGNGKVHVGISSLNPYAQSTRGDLQRRIGLFLQKVPEYNKYVRSAKARGIKFFKISPILQAIDPMVKDNLLVVGDAAGQATAFFGLGSDPCFRMGEAAARVAVDAVKFRDYSSKFLMKYEKEWWKQFGRFELVNILLREIVAGYFTDEDWDAVVRSLQKISSKDFYNALKSEYSLGLVFRIFSFKTFCRLVWRVFKTEMKAGFTPKVRLRNLVSRV